MDVALTLYLKCIQVNNETLAAYQADNDLMCRADPRLQAHPWMPATIAIYSPPLDYGFAWSPNDNVTETAARNSTANNIQLVTKNHPGRAWAQSEPRWIPPPFGKYDDKRRVRPRDPSAKKLDFSLDIVSTGAKKGVRSARELCETPNAVGPSYVNMEEGLYCDMVNRKLLPVCSEEVTHDCLLVEGEGEDEEFKVVGSLDDVPIGAAINLLGVDAKPVVKTYKKVTRMKASKLGGKPALI
jgi:hypothetical protein